jgi:CRP/FNR family transcriptional regulator, dissimilatory nitrate respiration regulator
LTWIISTAREIRLSLTVTEVLRGCRLFSQVTSPGFERLVEMGRLHEFGKGERIFRQGQTCPGAYIVGSGLVRVFKVAPNGKEHVLHMVGPGNTFAEVAAIGGFDCPANAEAVAPSVCVLLPMDLLQKALHDSHQLCLELMTSLTFWVRHLIGLMEDVVLRDAISRLARYVLSFERTADGTMELPSLKRHVASHLNLTSETFSRTLGRLIEEGMVVELDGNRLQVVDLPGLQRIAEGWGTPERPR